MMKNQNSMLIYERVDNKIYARKVGEINRIEITRPFAEYEKLKQDSILWMDVLNSAKDNPALQRALANAIMIYRLSKKDPQ